MMPQTECLFLGLLQGVTEFLPVSSSGHLALAKHVIGLGEPSIAYDLVLHVATLLAVTIFFIRDISTLTIEWLYGFFKPRAREWAGWRFAWAVILGTVVTAPIALVLKKFVLASLTNLTWLGVNFWITSLLLLSTIFIAKGRRSVGPADGIAVGLFQGLAVMPGISRSGATICGGLYFGLTKEEAFRFSFLLSIPAIAGATLVEALEAGGVDSFMATLPTGWFYGSVVAFLSGLVSLFLLRKLVLGDRWWYFGIYCALLGSASLIFSLIGSA